MKPAFFQMVQHPVVASDIVGRMLISAGQNNMRASQARLSTNSLAEQVEDLFMQDFDLETQYHSLLDGMLYCYASIVLRSHYVNRQMGSVSLRYLAVDCGLIMELFNVSMMDQTR